MISKTENKLKEMQEKLDLATSYVSGMVEDVGTLLNGYDPKLAESIIGRDASVNKLDSDINKICVYLLALHEPKAQDLRLVIATLNIIGELESIADYCEGIAKEIVRNGEDLYKVDFIKLPKLFKETSAMIKDSIKAFHDRDDRLALSIIERDDRVDKIHKKILKKSVESLTDYSEMAPSTVSLIFITRSLERAADHAATIAEHAYYMATGEIIKNVAVREVRDEGESSSSNS
ncbi:phosphate signaling complex protein PhoU [Limisalsivibrio acetivorans]|uniref:phosphate signaling complex protein PhoU n=1 Tax=Limisalsivibrio acetivorans TaxID=1304888 RepID=UPI0003B69AEA|nr:phosphate signaling complex protein PhoU [Limisalsivibrio acetivorans]